MEQLGSKWTDFREVRCLSILRKSVEKIQVFFFFFFYNLRSITAPLHEDQCAFFIMFRSFHLIKRTVSDRNCRENQNTHFVLHNFFSRKLCRLWDMWENTVEPDRPQMTIWRMRLASWVTKTTDTHSEYVIRTLIFHCNNGCTNAPQFDVIRTLSVLC